MLEADAVQRVVKLDVDPEVVRIELQPIVTGKRRFLRDRPASAWRPRQRKTGANGDSTQVRYRKRAQEI
jgi:hypothetical protein